MKPYRLLIVLAALCLMLPLLLIDLSIAGCAAGTSGLARPLSDQAFTTATNTIGTTTQILTSCAPAPWAEIFRIAAGVSIAALTAWQSYTHSRVTKLTNGQSATTNKKSI